MIQGKALTQLKPLYTTPNVTIYKLWLSSQIILLTVGCKSIHPPVTKCILLTSQTQQRYDVNFLWLRPQSIVSPLCVHLL